MIGGTNLKNWLVMSVFLVGIVSVAAGRTIYVDNVGSGDFSNIQAAINDANDGDTISVADGTYTGYGNRDINFLGKVITLRSENGPEDCIIDCNGTESERHRGFIFHSGENANSAIIGFTITNGYAQEQTVADPFNPYWLSKASIGGAILCWNSSPTISNCTIRDNRAIGDNPPYHDGGGGIACYGYSFFPINPNPTITNCTFSGNSASYGGGGVACFWISNPIITNCTFSGNSASYEGGGMYNWHSSPTLDNCILWGNSPEEIYVYDSTPVITYSNVQGSWSGPGNINTDPCFADPCNGDYHLKAQAGRWDANERRWTKDDVTSPCIDAGNPNSPIGHEPFPNGGLINMGAYGGTTEASKSYFGEPVCETIVAGDINGDCKVNFIDFAILANNWLRTSFVESIFDFAVATKGALNLQGNIEIGGASIFIDASVYIESLNDANALDIIGNSHIAGDVFIINPDAIVTLQGGQASIGGETGQDAIDNHVNFGAPSIEFPVPEPNYFRHYVLNTYDPNNVLTEYDNVIIPAGTNPLFGAVRFRGVVFIEAPNIVRFGGNTEITGIIVGNGDLNDNSGTNQIWFTGTVTSSPVTDLPNEPQFEQFRDETGTFLMAPGFKAIFFGNFGTLNGAIAANGIEFGGNAGGTIDGSVINYSDQPMTISGNSDLFFNRSGTAKVPAGFD